MNLDCLDGRNLFAFKTVRTDIVEIMCAHKNFPLNDIELEYEQSQNENQLWRIGICHQSHQLILFSS